MTGEAVIMDNQYGTDRGLHKICYICRKHNTYGVDIRNTWTFDLHIRL